MKYFFLAFGLLYSLASFSAQFEIIGPCQEKPIYQFDVEDRFDTVADMTFHILNRNNIPYEGTDKGITSLLNAPHGDDALEILSDTQMRAYGWCFFVNGKLTSSYADETYLKADDKVQWIYSYAWFDRGWQSMCNFAYQIKSDFICR